MASIDVSMPVADAYVHEQSPVVGTNSAASPPRPAVIGQARADEAPAYKPWQVFPVSSSLSGKPLQRLSLTDPSPGVWATAPLVYERVATSDAYYQQVILGAPAEPSRLSTSARNNTDSLLHACRVASAYWSQPHANTAVAPSTIWEVYFSALSVVVLQYWACVNERFVAYRPGASRKFLRRMPNSLLLVFPGTDFVQTSLLQSTTAAKARKTTVEQKIPATVRAFFRDGVADTVSDLRSMVAGRSFADAVLLVAAFHILLEPGEFSHLVSFVTMKITRGYHLFFPSRRFNVFPWANVDDIVFHTASIKRLNDRERVPPVAVRFKFWFPQKGLFAPCFVKHKTSAERRMHVPPHIIPLAFGHVRFGAHAPLLDISHLSAEHQQSTHHALWPVVAQALFFLPPTSRIVRLIGRTKGLPQLKVSKKPGQEKPSLLEEAERDFATHLVDPVSLRFGFVANNAQQAGPALVYSAPLRCHFPSQPISEHSPLGITPSLVQFALDSIPASATRWILRDVFVASVDSRLLSVMWLPDTKQLVRNERGPFLLADDLNAWFISRFGDADVHPVSAEDTNDFFFAALLIAGGNEVVACALLARHVSPALQASPALLVQALHRSYAAKMRSIATLRSDIVACAKSSSRFAAGVAAVDQYFSGDDSWSYFDAPAVDLRTASIFAKTLTPDSARWMIARRPVFSRPPLKADEQKNLSAVLMRAVGMLSVSSAEAEKFVRSAPAVAAVTFFVGSQASARTGSGMTQCELLLSMLDSVRQIFFDLRFYALMYFSEPLVPWQTQSRVQAGMSAFDAFQRDAVAAARSDRFRSLLLRVQPTSKVGAAFLRFCLAANSDDLKMPAVDDVISSTEKQALLASSADVSAFWESSVATLAENGRAYGQFPVKVLAELLTCTQKVAAVAGRQIGASIDSAAVALNIVEDAIARVRRVDISKARSIEAHLESPAISAPGEAAGQLRLLLSEKRSGVKRKLAVVNEGGDQGSHKRARGEEIESD